MSRDLAGMVVVVAGASSGMGRATARALGAAGARVVAGARNTDALRQTVETITAAGGEAFAVPTDATDAAACRRLVAVATDRYGRLDALVNAVGTNIRNRALDDLTEESWAEMLATNLTAAFHLTRAAVPVMRAQGMGVLIHIASSAARKPDRSGVAYQATKAGVAALAHGTMEEERANGLRVSVIYPGLTDTPLVLKRPTPTPPEVLAQALQPEDIADACLFILGMPPRAHVPELVVYPSRV